MNFRDVSWAAAIHRVMRAAVPLMAAALLITATIWWLIASAGGTEEYAARNLAVTAQALAAAIDAPLARFAQLTEGFRPADFVSTDRLAMTARQIRLQGAVPYASTTFLVNRAGQVIAASVPVPPGEADVGQSKWFQHGAEQSAGALALQRIDPSWLRVGSMVVVTRNVIDEFGRSVGLVGAIFRLEDIRALVRPTWISPTVSSSLIAQDGSTRIETETSPTAVLNEASVLSDVLPRLLLALDRLTGRPTTLVASAEVPSIRATVQTSLPSDIAIRATWSDPSAAMPGFLLVGAMVCLLLMAILTGGRKRGDVFSTAAVYGADWTFDLDDQGRLTSTDGFVPEPICRGLGKPFIDVLEGAAGENDLACKCIASTIKARVRLDALDIRVRAAEGGDHIHRLSLAPMPSGGVRGTARDVSESVGSRVRAEAAEGEAATLREQVEAVASDRDGVLAAVGHDVRTPMNSILGICALLLEEGDLEDTQRTWIERIDASCEALLAMLNGLLEMASGAGSVELQPAEVDVAGLVDEVCGVLAPQAHDKGLQISTRFDDAVHGCWMADPTRLRQVLFNLASNAIKYTSSGSVEIRASAITDADARTSIRLTVSDTGSGIAHGDRSLIFERFKRGGGEASEGREGLGLGLALCRENAALMGGSLTVESTVGVGSEFTFEFPAGRPGPERQRQPYIGRTALVVGFDEAHASRFSSHLARMGVAVETAEDGFLAIGQGERMASRCGALDAVIVNAGMTGMQPDAFFTRLRSTAYGQRSAIVAVGVLGSGVSMADAVLPQSADGKQVATTVATFLAAVPALECIHPSAPLPGAARVLVVEDNKVNQSLLSAALSRRGFTTFVADGGEAAVRLAASVGFDAILMDLQMPGVDGFEATRRIRAMGGRMASMPIIALSALTGAVVRKRCADERMTARIVKPVNLDQLAAELSRWIEKSRSTISNDSGGDETGAMTESGPVDGSAEVSVIFLESMVSDIGLDRTRACMQEFIADVTARCSRLSELLPGWEADAIIRICYDIGGRAGDFGAIGLADALEELADQTVRGDREGAGCTARRIEASITRTGGSMIATLSHLARHGHKDDREAA